MLRASEGKETILLEKVLSFFVKNGLFPVKIEKIGRRDPDFSGLDLYSGKKGARMKSIKSIGRIRK